MMLPEEWTVLRLVAAWSHERMMSLHRHAPAQELRDALIAAEKARAELTPQPRVVDTPQHLP